MRHTRMSRSQARPYCSIRRPTNPTGEAFAATMRNAPYTNVEVPGAAVLLDQEADEPDRRGVCRDDALVQFEHREARRQRRHVEPVLCDSQTPTASIGTSAINC